VFMLMKCRGRRKRTSQYYDPCQEAANKSIKCMHRNGGDRDMCQDYFQCVGALCFSTGSAMNTSRSSSHNTSALRNRKLIEVYTQGISRLQKRMGMIPSGYSGDDILTTWADGANERGEKVLVQLK
jgi:cytochrome c oxidase assembly protein subunit 23